MYVFHIVLNSRTVLYITETSHHRFAKNKHSPVTTGTLLEATPHLPLFCVTLLFNANIVNVQEMQKKLTDQKSEGSGV